MTKYFSASCIVILIIGYFLGVWMPGIGQKALGSVGVTV